MALSKTTNDILGTPAVTESLSGHERALLAQEVAEKLDYGVSEAMQFCVDILQQVNANREALAVRDLFKNQFRVTL